MSKVAISIGGSILAPNEVDVPLVKALAAMLKEVSRDHQLFITVGGGAIARRYINACREFDADETFLDEVGIAATRLNAAVLIAALGEDCYHQPAMDLHEAMCAAKDHQMIVMGGTHPCQTTDAVSAMLAEKVRAARLVNATNVDGVYTADPKKEKSAKFIDRITAQGLLDIMGKASIGAGQSYVLDPVAVKIVARSGIPAIVVNGKDVGNLRRAIIGQDFKGTLIVDK